MDPFQKSSSGSYYKVSSDLKFTSQIPYHRDLEDYLKQKEKEKNIQQFKLTESPLNKIQEDNCNDSNRDDSLEYRSLAPSLDFVFSHSKKSTEAKDPAKYSSENKASSIFKNFQDPNFSDLKLSHNPNQQSSSKYGYSQNKKYPNQNTGELNSNLTNLYSADFRKNQSESSQKQAGGQNRNPDGKVCDSYAGVDGKNYNNNNTIKDVWQSDKKQLYDSNFDSNSRSNNVDYYFKNGIIKNETEDNSSFQKNDFTSTPTKDTSRYQRSNSDYQRSQQHLFNDRHRFAKNRSASHQKCLLTDQNNSSSLYKNKVKDILSNRSNNYGSYSIPQSASFRNAADFYSVQHPENQQPYQSMYQPSNSTSYLANEDAKRRLSFDKPLQKEYNSVPSKIDTFSCQKPSGKLNEDTQDQLYNQMRGNDYNIFHHDVNKDSTNLLYLMKEKQIKYEKKLQDILKGQQDNNQKISEDYFQKKQEKDQEIQKQYKELQKFKQSTSHFNQNLNYDLVPDISEIKDLNHSNISSSFINRDSYSPYTPVTSAYKTQQKSFPKYQSENQSFLKNSAPTKEHNNNNSSYYINLSNDIYNNQSSDNFNSLKMYQQDLNVNQLAPNQSQVLENQAQMNGNQPQLLVDESQLQDNIQSVQKQQPGKEQNSYILEVDDSFQKKNNQTDKDKQIELQQKEIESLKKKIHDDEIERIAQKKIQNEQQKKIEQLQKEIQNLTQKFDTWNINQQKMANTQQHPVSDPHKIQNKVQSNKPENNKLKVIQNYGVEQQKQPVTHNFGSGMKFNEEQKFRFKIIELLQVENDDDILQKIQNLIQYKRQNESFSHCIIDTLEQLAPDGHFKSKKPTLLESWKFIKQVLQQYVNLTQEKRKLKSVAKHLSEAITKGLEAENENLLNSIKNILIL